MKVDIRIVGTEGVTEFDMNVSEYELGFLRKISKKSKEEKSIYDPWIEVKLVEYERASHDK